MGDPGSGQMRVVGGQMGRHVRQQSGQEGTGALAIAAVREGEGELVSRGQGVRVAGTQYRLPVVGDIGQIAGGPFPVACFPLELGEG